MLRLSSEGTAVETTVRSEFWKLEFGRFCGRTTRSLKRTVLFWCTVVALVLVFVCGFVLRGIAVHACVCVCGCCVVV